MKPSESLAAAIEANDAAAVARVLEEHHELKAHIDEPAPCGAFGQTALLAAVQRHAGGGVAGRRAGAAQCDAAAPGRLQRECRDGAPAHGFITPRPTSKGDEFDGTPLGWARHGAEHGPHRETADYAGTIEALLAEGAP